jgi:hypothetical protein
VTHILVLEVTESDGLCICAKGTPHIHVVEERLLRENVIKEAAFDPEAVRRIVLEELTKALARQADAMTVAKAEELRRPRTAVAKAEELVKNGKRRG